MSYRLHLHAASCAGVLCDFLLNPPNVPWHVCLVSQRKEEAWEVLRAQVAEAGAEPIWEDSRAHLCECPMAALASRHRPTSLRQRPLSISHFSWVWGPGTVWLSWSLFRVSQGGKQGVGWAFPWRPRCSETAARTQYLFTLSVRPLHL